MNNYNQEIIKFIQKLVSIPSVNGVNNETEIINAIKNEAEKLELPNRIIYKNSKHPNIFVGENFSEKKGLLLIAHVDTAGIGDETLWTKKPFGGNIEGNKLFGRGAIDNKAGIALSLYTLRVLKDQNKLHMAKFVGVSDEEKGADSVFGARYLLEHGLQAEAAIYTYSGNDAITIGHRGQVKMWINITGESAHTGSKGWQDGTKGASAIETLIKLLSKLDGIKLKGRHSAFPGYKFKQTVLYIEGGSMTSLVPDKAKVLIDARLLPNHPNDEYINIIDKSIKMFENKKIKINTEINTNLPASYINKSEKIVKILQKLSKEILNKNPEIRGCGPANEGYMFINSGIPTICGFGVNGDGMHSKDEFLDIESIPKILEIYVKTALTI
jgi:acetylornithine deacetylase/succinyl-diaminopimelate desuccinylase-like protein